METERITFQDGNWVEIKVRLTRGMQKQIDLASFKAIPYDRLRAAGVDVEDPQALRKALVTDPEYVTAQVLNDTILLVGIKSFSYADKVTQETLDEIDTSQNENLAQVLARLMELWYSERAKHADFFVKP